MTKVSITEILVHLPHPSLRMETGGVREWILGNWNLFVICDLVLVI